MAAELVDERAPADDSVVRRLALAELPPIVDEVLARPRIQDECDKHKLDPAELRERLLADPDELLSPTNTEISAYRDAVRALGEVGPGRARERTWPSDYRAVLEFFLLLLGSAEMMGAALLVGVIARGGLPVIVKIVLGLVVAAGVVALYFAVPIGALITVTERLPPPRLRPLGTHRAAKIARWLAFLVLAVAVYALLPALERSLTVWGAIAASLLAVIALVLAFSVASLNPDMEKVIARNVGVRRARLRADAAAALDVWRDAARATVVPAVNRLISRLSAPSYDVRLTVRDDSGLGTMANLDRVVATAARERLRRVLGRMRSGAVGIAGPRGVGKTTLIEVHREGWLLPRGREHVVIRVDAPIGYEGRDFALHIYAAACEAVIDTLRTERKKWIFGRQPAEDKVRLDVVEDATRRLDRIRYLQTSTTGWSGKVTLPGTGADVSASRSTAKASQPLTYPEIINELRKFLTRVAALLSFVNSNAAATPLVVAIDELDKIASAEHAYRFVNELKALFGVPGCHFVLSVSEDALISFERRGFAVRDAFDSAFDEIIRVDYLTLAESRELLSSRLIGVPEPFVTFAYCFSGGLPRDLIRVARAMMDITHTTPAPGLAHVCAALTGTAIEQAARLAQRELRPLAHAASVVELIRLADGPSLTRRPPGELQATIGKLVQTTEETATVRLELATLLYFALTLREVFTDDLTKDQIVTASLDPGPGSFETLARARQAFGDNMTHAWLLIEEFRAAWRLPVVEL
ncbi:hypothetical protein [Amycolatopsis sp. GM8]|uniref:hypothetical protein n=1 Tax=Amycolatopsis sp. GM8 TaxID=2896530 RepID=UPI001F400C83|nr:hypothetical protein [Amycolatopsis sp. GM8]